jgi:hypothetical protein
MTMQQQCEATTNGKRCDSRQGRKVTISGRLTSVTAVLCEDCEQALADANENWIFTELSDGTAA